MFLFWSQLQNLNLLSFCTLSANEHQDLAVSLLLVESDGYDHSVVFGEVDVDVVHVVRSARRCCFGFAEQMELLCVEDVPFRLHSNDEVMHLNFISWLRQESCTNSKY